MKSGKTGSGKRGFGRVLLILFGTGTCRCLLLCDVTGNQYSQSGILGIYYPFLVLLSCSMD